MTKASDLRTVDLEDVTEHYVQTLADWRSNCELHAEEIKELGHDEYFNRLWEFYLCYCEGGFKERAIGDIHYFMARPKLACHPLHEIKGAGMSYELAAYLIITAIAIPVFSWVGCASKKPKTRESLMSCGPYSPALAARRFSSLGRVIFSSACQ